MVYPKDRRGSWRLTDSQKAHACSKPAPARGRLTARCSPLWPGSSGHLVSFERRSDFADRSPQTTSRVVRPSARLPGELIVGRPCRCDPPEDPLGRPSYGFLRRGHLGHAGPVGLPGQRPPDCGPVVFWWDTWPPPRNCHDWLNRCVTGAGSSPARRRAWFARGIWRAWPYVRIIGWWGILDSSSSRVAWLMERFCRRGEPARPRVLTVRIRLFDPQGDRVDLPGRGDNAALSRSWGSQAGVGSNDVIDEVR